MKMSWICASSASARHQLQRSLMLGFAHAPGTWPSSSPAAPGSRHGRSGSSRELMSNGCSHGLRVFKLRCQVDRCSSDFFSRRVVLSVIKALSCALLHHKMPATFFVLCTKPTHEGNPAVIQSRINLLISLI